MMEKLNDNEIIREYVLSKIIRYNHRRRLQNESVAEHSFYVSLFCLKIMQKIPDLTEKEKNAILTISILHDTAESITSDIPHDVKVNYPEMKKILKNIEDQYYEENWKEYIELIKIEDGLIYDIIKLADNYSVYQYCINEKSLGNISDDIDKIYFDCQKRINMWIDKINKELEKRRN